MSFTHEYPFCCIVPEVTLNPDDILGSVLFGPYKQYNCGLATMLVAEELSLQNVANSSRRLSIGKSLCCSILTHHHKFHCNSQTVNHHISDNFS